eukprot:8023563-Pyramimonas_sp.AAC.1
MPLERACHSNVTWQGRQLAELRRDEELLLPRDLGRQLAELRRDEELLLPRDLDYSAVGSLSAEERERLQARNG